MEATAISSVREEVEAAWEVTGGRRKTPSLVVGFGLWRKRRRYDRGMSDGGERRPATREPLRGRPRFDPSPNRLSHWAGLNSAHGKSPPRRPAGEEIWKSLRVRRLRCARTDTHWCRHCRVVFVSPLATKAASAAVLPHRGEPMTHHDLGSVWQEFGSSKNSSGSAFSDRVASLVELELF